VDSKGQGPDSRLRWRKRRSGQWSAHGRRHVCENVVGRDRLSGWSTPDLCRTMRIRLSSTRERAMSQIFVSYASADRERVERLVHALEADGLEVWWDRDIASGQSFHKVIE